MKKILFRLKISFVSFLLAGAMTSMASAQYVWTPDASGSYSGTSSPWTADASRTGKWVTSGTNNVFTGTTILEGTGVNSSLYIQNATVGISGAQIFVRPSSTLTVKTGGVLNLATGIQMTAKSDSEYSSIRIESGGALNVSGGYLWLGNAEENRGATTKIDIDGGTFNVSASPGFWLGHQQRCETTIQNNGTLSSSVALNVGFGQSSAKIVNDTQSRGVITIGTENSLTDFSVLRAPSITIGQDSRGEIILNSGTIETTAGGLAVGNTVGSILTTNGGTVKIKTSLAVAPIAVGNITTTLSDYKVSYLTAKNTDFQIGEAIEFCQSGQAQISIQDSTISAQSLKVGSGSTGTGTVDISGTEISLSGDFIASRGATTISEKSSVVSSVGSFSGGVSGLNSSFTLDDSTFSGTDFNVNGGTTALQNGAVASLRGTVSVNNGAELSVLSGSILNVNGAFSVNSNSTALVGDEAELRASSVTIAGANSGSITVSGGRVDTNELTIRTTGTNADRAQKLVIENGGQVAVSNSFWFFSSAENQAVLEIKSGGRFTTTSNVFVADNGSSTGTIIIDGGTMESGSNTSEWIRLGHWGGFNLTVTNGGRFISNQITAMSYTRDSNVGGTGEINLSGGGELISGSTVAIGNNSRGDVAVNYTNTELGFGKITAVSSIAINTPTTTINFDPQSLAMAVNYDYDPVNGQTLMKGSSITSGAWTVGETKNGWKVASNAAGNEIYAQRADDSQGTFNVGDSIVLGTALGSGWFYINPSSDPYLMTLNTIGLSDMTQTEAFADSLNEQFSVLTATAEEANTILLSGFELRNTGVAFSWDFSQLAGFTDVKLSGGMAQSVPEPSTWVLLVLGAVGIGLIRKRRPVQ